MGASSRTILVTLAVAGAAAACDSTSPTPLAGTFDLRAVYAAAPPYAPVPLPATFATGAPGDSTRWLGGTFSLAQDGTWQERLEEELVFAAGAPNPRTLLTGGRYRVSSVVRGRLVLDLYPDQVVPAVVSPIALLSGDTLSHAAALFVR